MVHQILSLDPEVFKRRRIQLEPVWVFLGKEIVDPQRLFDSAPLEIDLLMKYNAIAKKRIPPGAECYLEFKTWMDFTTFTTVFEAYAVMHKDDYELLDEYWHRTLSTCEWCGVEDYADRNGRCPCCTAHR